MKSYFEIEEFKDDWSIVCSEDDVSNVYILTDASEEENYEIVQKMNIYKYFLKMIHLKKKRNCITVKKMKIVKHKSLKKLKTIQNKTPPPNFYNKHQKIKVRSQ